MDQIQVYISANYKENEDTTFNYKNNVSGKQFVDLSFNEVEKMGKQDAEKGLTIAYPSELNLSQYS